MPRPAINDYTFYKIVNVNGDCEMCYVGSSCDMKHRRITHKYRCNTPKSKRYNTKVYQTIREHGGWDEFQIVEIGAAEQITLTESHIIEETYRIELKATMNTNRCIITKDGMKERDKQYRTDNADKIKERQKQYNIDNADKNKQYRIDNVDKIKEHDKQYRTDNAEHIKENKKQYRIDNAEKLKENNNQYRIDNADKIKEKRQQYNIDNADKLKEYHKQYNIDNADKIKEHKKQYRIDNSDKAKEKHTCECGGKYTTASISRHIKTAKHQNYLSKFKPVAEVVNP